MRLLYLSHCKTAIFNQIVVDVSSWNCRESQYCHLIHHAVDVRSLLFTHRLPFRISSILDNHWLGLCLLLIDYNFPWRFLPTFNDFTFVLREKSWQRSFLLLFPGLLFITVWMYLLLVFVVATHLVLLKRVRNLTIPAIIQFKVIHSF